MYIQEIIIDGFKSYAHRTVIEGFDPHFNAITGLNGSGKSNILDSICFVLGITNLSQVRAGNLSELVYKQGQAGVNKATVTIVFNNEDESSSPVGYEQCSEVTVTRQVLIGGKSKYMINGRNAPTGQVNNLFHSVQLNVNNPHFLIMQGRITKVLNMKPHEILGMVEEAAGTRMYETKRVAAIKTIDKKQAKVDELNAVLAEEITPTLERLRGEKENYLKWSKNNADIERIERFVLASEFMKVQASLENNSSGSAEMESQIAELEQAAHQYREEIVVKDKEIQERSSSLGGELESLHDLAKQAEAKHSKELVKATSVWNHSKDVVKKAQKDVEAAKLVIDETKSAVLAKEAELAEESVSIKEKTQSALEAEQFHAKLTLQYQNMSAGISSMEGVDGRTLPDQISKAHSDSKIAESRANQARMKIRHLSKELKTVKADIQSEEDAVGKLTSEKEKAVSRVQAIKKSIEELSFCEREFNVLEEEKTRLDSAITDLKHSVDTLSAQLEGRLKFNYTDPVRGFDRDKVKGLVARLVKVKHPQHATALEVVAGGKLYQVVVDEAITGKALLNRGKLERRVTIIPLDKIKPRHISHGVLKQATSLASAMNSTASPAIQLVGFDEEVRTAMEYVFGAALVVDDMKAANKICDDTKTRTVTLEGDVYDPSGTISGGSKNQLGSTLSKLTELLEATEKLTTHQVLLQATLTKLSSLEGKSREFGRLNGNLELAEAELDEAEKHLSQTSYGMLVKRFETLSGELECANKDVAEMEKEKDDKWILYEELKAQETELTQQREHRLKEIEDAEKEAKENALRKSKIAREAESRSQTLQLELESLSAEADAAVEAVKTALKLRDQAVSEETEKEVQVRSVKDRYDESKNALESVEKQVRACSTAIAQLQSTRTQLMKKAEAATVDAKKLSIAVSRIQKERATAERTIENMLSKHSWIKSERSAFGLAGGDYDFEAVNPTDMKKQLNALRVDQDLLCKKINKKVMGMIEKAEGEYTELLRKRKVVENDKKKIQSVIEELDVKKKSELQRTWVKVNQDFGSIFSTLLPGTSAKLEPPEGMEAWEGLEVKVAFGDVWKESLSELSGGQRSLLALSLILSMLLFKPAPMYILDEVDAALDLSHTQNIGNMLKTHFSQSQFVVVSLKEGMFNNANVIFRTKFLDGVSTVTRTMGTGSSMKNAVLHSTENTGKATVEKRTRRRQSRRDEKENVEEGEM